MKKFLLLPPSSMMFAFLFALAVAFAFSFTLVFAADAPKAPDFTGTWHWKFTMPDGTAATPKLKLKQEGRILTGTSSLRSGTDGMITNSAVTGTEARFEVVRRQHGITVTTRYTGKLDGDLIHGQVESDWTGQVQTYPWEAKRFAGIEGTWKWSVPFGTRRFETRATFQLEGEKLHGTMPGGRGGAVIEITKGVFKNNEVSFEAERGRGTDFQSITWFEGKLEGEKITGIMVTTFGENPPRTNDWDAVRAE